MRRLLPALAVFALLLLGPGLAGQAQEPPRHETMPMTVATKNAPPFSFKDERGEWTGIALEMWRDIAHDLGFEVHFEEAPIGGIIDGVATGRYGAGVAAITVTPEREARIDFSHPYYSTGWGIAVRAQPGGGWTAVLGRFFSLDFLGVVAALAGVLMGAGALVYLFERRANPQDFGGSLLSGLVSGFWWSAVTMTTVGYGDKVPRTLGGRIVGIVWMFAAVIILASFTGAVASALTAEQLSTAVKGPQDLPRVRVGTVAGTASEALLKERHVRFAGFAAPQAGLAALAKGEIDAFVHDLPILQYTVRNGFLGTLTLLPQAMGRQDYGVVLPPGSPLRKAVNQKILDYLDSPRWADLVARHLGM